MSASTATLLAGGTCALRAEQAGNLPFAPAGQLAITVAIAQGAQTITVAQPPDRRRGQSPQPLTATVSSGLTVAFASATPSICRVGNSPATRLAVGTCSLRATQAGDATCVTAAAVERRVPVLPALAASCACCRGCWAA